MNKKIKQLEDRRKIRAFAQIKRYLFKKYKISNKGLKMNAAIKLFCKDFNIDIKTNLKNWLLNMYLTGENEYIGRMNNSFYQTTEWKHLRKKVLDKYGIVCMKCGFECDIPHIDHIKPRSKYKELELDFNNMQVLCNICNIIKSNKDFTDYRPVYT